MKIIVDAMGGDNAPGDRQRAPWPDRSTGAWTLPSPGTSAAILDALDHAAKGAAPGDGDRPHFPDSGHV